MIALVTIAHNEAHRMREHLEFASVYCDELVVVVQDSDDGTADVVSDFGAKLVRDEHRGFSEASRTLAFTNVESDWVMYLDADEHLDPVRIPDLRPVQEEFDSARVPVYTYIDGTLLNPTFWDGRIYQDRQVRFFHKDRVIWGDGIHMRIVANTDREFITELREPWVLNVKAGWEQELDNARYLAIEQEVA